jgi:hypothetical protein
MKMSSVESPSASQRSKDESHAKLVDSGWKPLYNVGGAVALISVVFIPIQLFIFIAWSPPDTVKNCLKKAKQRLGVLPSSASWRCRSRLPLTHSVVHNPCSDGDFDLTTRMCVQ